MSRHRAPMVLTERGEWVRDGLCAILALLAIPGGMLIIGKLVGM